MKILFLVPYPTEGASNRIRVEQFIPYLKTKGLTCRVRPFMNSRFFRILYLPHRFLEKMLWFIMSTFNRILDVARAVRYDAVFIHRESYPFGGAFIEKILHMMGKPIIFDFDDAIFLPDTSEQNAYIERFKNSGKVADIIRLSTRVIVGNEYLADYATRHNRNVCIIPSSVDTDRYKPMDSRGGGKDIVIGWIGSNTTKRFLYDLEDIFTEISSKYPNAIFKIVGAPFYSSMSYKVVNKAWSLKDEVDDIRSFDIGIMPIPDNEWTRGKCGFKAILYMACGIPVVASAVGVNVRIIQDGVDGFLVKDKSGWIDRLTMLINDKALREKIGDKAREKVSKKYSTAYTAPLFYNALKRVLSV